MLIVVLAGTGNDVVAAVLAFLASAWSSPSRDGGDSGVTYTHCGLLFPCFFLGGPFEDSEGQDLT